MVASYRISNSLAIGGMAEVFEAEHAVLPRRVALKVMHPELLRKQDMDTRFLREACILESFSHPGGVRVFECGVLPDGRPWMAMELVRGHALSKEMHQPMSPAKIVSILSSVVEVLAAAHKIGLIHRDLKPDNLLLSDNPADFPVRVIDWGLARLDTFTRLTQDGTAAGTPLYMSPEQTQGKPLDGRCDIYSLGVVAYEALAGVPPFDGQNLVEIVVRQVTTEPTPLWKLRSDVPRALSELITKMMTRDPAHRPTAAQLLPELATLAALMAPPAPMEQRDIEEPILEYSIEPTRVERRDLHLKVEVGRLPDGTAAPIWVDSTAPTKVSTPCTTSQAMAELLALAKPARPAGKTASASTTALRRRPLTPATRSTNPPSLTPTPGQPPVAAGAVRSPSAASESPASSTPGEPIEVRAQMHPTAGPNVAGREVAPGGTRVHWTPEPVSLDALPGDLGAAARRRQRELAPRGPTEQWSREQLAAGQRRN